jgi:N-acetylglucosaminyldiphosphoundecaprenol N-acetyl-beta-D-mannosaminyltransferase
MRVDVDGLDFDKVTMSEAVDAIVAMAKKRDRARYVCTGNLDHLVIASRNPEFRSAYEAADLVVADGTAIVWLSRLSTPSCDALAERVTGSDLFWELTRASASEEVRLFLLGGLPGAAERAAIAATRRYPGASIVGTYCPPFDTFDTDAEQARIRQRVQEARPDILLVALGAPKQELWIARNKDALGVPVSMGVGGSFEMAAGDRRRAPRWIQRTGFEWLYRFSQEPDRLFRRYFVEDLPYFSGAAARAIARRFGT